MVVGEGLEPPIYEPDELPLLYPAVFSVVSTGFMDLTQESLLQYFRCLLSQNML